MSGAGEEQRQQQQQQQRGEGAVAEGAGHCDGEAGVCREMMNQQDFISFVSIDYLRRFKATGKCPFRPNEKRNF